MHAQSHSPRRSMRTSCFDVIIAKIGAAESESLAKRDDIIEKIGVAEPEWLAKTLDDAVMA